MNISRERLEELARILNADPDELLKTLTEKMGAMALKADEWGLRLKAATPAPSFRETVAGLMGDDGAPDGPKAARAAELKRQIAQLEDQLADLMIDDRPELVTKVEQALRRRQQGARGQLEGTVKALDLP